MAEKDELMELLEDDVLDDTGLGEDENLANFDDYDPDDHSTTAAAAAHAAQAAKSAANRRLEESFARLSIESPSPRPTALPKRRLTQEEADSGVSCESSPAASEEANKSTGIERVMSPPMSPPIRIPAAESGDESDDDDFVTPNATPRKPNKAPERTISPPIPIPSTPVRRQASDDSDVFTTPPSAPRMRRRDRSQTPTLVESTIDEAEATPPSPPKMRRMELTPTITESESSIDERLEQFPTPDVVEPTINVAEAISPPESQQTRLEPTPAPAVVELTEASAADQPEESSAALVWKALDVNQGIEERSPAPAEDESTIDEAPAEVEPEDSAAAVWKALDVHVESVQEVVEAVEDGVDDEGGWQTVEAKPPRVKKVIVLDDVAVEKKTGYENRQPEGVYGRYQMYSIRAAIGAATMNHANYAHVDAEWLVLTHPRCLVNSFPRLWSEVDTVPTGYDPTGVKVAAAYFTSERKMNKKSAKSANFTAFTHSTDSSHNDGNNADTLTFNGWKAGQQQQQQHASGADGEWEWHVNEDTSGSNSPNDGQHSRKNSGDSEQRPHSEDEETPRAHYSDLPRTNGFGEKDRLEKSRDNWKEWQNKPNVPRQPEISYGLPPGLKVASQPQYPQSSRSSKVYDEPDQFGNPSPEVEMRRSQEGSATKICGPPPGFERVHYGDTPVMGRRSDDGSSLHQGGFGERAEEREWDARDGRGYGSRTQDDHRMKNGRRSRGGSKDSHHDYHEQNDDHDEYDQYGNRRKEYYEEERRANYIQRRAYKSDFDNVEETQTHREQWEKIGEREEEQYNRGVERYRQQSPERVSEQRRSVRFSVDDKRDSQSSRRSDEIRHSRQGFGERNEPEQQSDNNSRNQRHIMTLTSGLRVTREASQDGQMEESYQSASDRSFDRRGTSSHDFTVTRRFTGPSDDFKVTLHQESHERATTSASAKDRSQSRNHKTSRPKYSEEEQKLLDHEEKMDRMRARMYRINEEGVRVPAFPVLNRMYGAELPEEPPLRAPSSTTKWLRGPSDYMAYLYYPALDTAWPIEDEDIPKMYRSGLINARSLFAMKFEGDFYTQEQLLSETESQESPFNGVLEEMRRETEINLDTFSFQQWTAELQDIIDNNAKWEKQNRW